MVGISCNPSGGLWTPGATDASDLCVDNWVCHTNGKCYKYFSSAKTWTNANSDCALHLIS